MRLREKATKMPVEVGVDINGFWTENSDKLFTGIGYTLKELAEKYEDIPTIEVVSPMSRQEAPSFKARRFTVITVVQSEDDMLKFDNGFYIGGYHSQDCCEYNFLDFEQFKVGDKFPSAETLGDLIKQIRIKEDGFFMADAQGIPKWAQARSHQNGYYSTGVGLKVGDGEIEWRLSGPKGWRDEYFVGKELDV